MESVISSPDFAKVKNFAAAIKKYSAFHNEKEISWDNRFSYAKGTKYRKYLKKAESL